MMLKRNMDVATGFGADSQKLCRQRHVRYLGPRSTLVELPCSVFNECKMVHVTLFAGTFEDPPFVAWKYCNCFPTPTNTA